MAGRTWMNTGEGGVFPHHLTGGVDIIMQIGPGLFGVRTRDGEFSEEEFMKKANTEEIKAFEVKLAQGAKTRGGHIEAEKVTEEIAEIRNVEPWTKLDSPNRFKEFNDVEGLMEFVEMLRDLGGKPVGVKIDRKSTRLNSSYVAISYAVFCLKKKTNTTHPDEVPPRSWPADTRHTLFPQAHSLTSLATDALQLPLLHKPPRHPA